MCVCVRGFFIEIFFVIENGFEFKSWTRLYSFHSIVLDF